MNTIETIKHEIEKMRALGVGSVQLPIEDVEALVAEVERVNEKLAWLGKGKARPLEADYQKYLAWSEEHEEDSPLDYVMWLEDRAWRYIENSR